MLRLVAAQAESLWDEALPIEVRELPSDLAALDGPVLGSASSGPRWRTSTPASRGSMVWGVVSPTGAGPTTAAIAAFRCRIDGRRRQFGCLRARNGVERCGRGCECACSRDSRHFARAQSGAGGMDPSTGPGRVAGRSGAAGAGSWTPSPARWTFSAANRHCVPLRVYSRSRRAGLPGAGRDVGLGRRLGLNAGLLVDRDDQHVLGRIDVTGRRSRPSAPRSAPWRSRS